MSTLLNYRSPSLEIKLTFYYQYPLASAATATFTIKAEGGTFFTALSEPTYPFTINIDPTSLAEGVTLAYSGKFFARKAPSTSGILTDIYTGSHIAEVKNIQIVIEESEAGTEGVGTTTFAGHLSEFRFIHTNGSEYYISDNIVTQSTSGAPVYKYSRPAYLYNSYAVAAVEPDPTEPTEPTTEPTEPTTEPTDPTEPTTEPTEPTEPTLPEETPGNIYISNNRVVAIYYDGHAVSKAYSYGRLVFGTEETEEPTEPTEPTTPDIPTAPDIDPVEPTTPAYKATSFTGTIKEYGRTLETSGGGGVIPSDYQAKMQITLSGSLYFDITGTSEVVITEEDIKNYANEVSIEHVDENLGSYISEISSLTAVKVSDDSLEYIKITEMTSVKELRLTVVPTEEGTFGGIINRLVVFTEDGTEYRIDLDELKSRDNVSNYDITWSSTCTLSGVTENE